MNIVFVVVDALRADRVGAFNGRDLTPNIDQLAAESAVFKNAFSTTNATDVAVTSIQTGRYPLSHGVINHGGRVTDHEKRMVEKVTQLPEMLAESGYRTAKFGRPLGRWHRKGFDIYPNTGGVKHHTGHLLERIHPKIRTKAAELYNSHSNLRSATAKLYQFSKNVSPPYKKDITKESVIEECENKNHSVVQKFEKFINDSEPSYAFIHLMDTHVPYVADPDLVKSCLDTYDYKADTAISNYKTDGPLRHLSHWDSFDKLIKSGKYPKIKERYYLPDGTPTTAITSAHYDASVMQADKQLGKILSVMKEAGCYEDSLIVFLSDHGESLTEHGIYYDHHGLYDVTTKIPLVIRPPGGANKEITDLVQITDLAPTVESYIGQQNLDADGHSLYPVIEDGTSIDRDYILAEEAHTQRRRMVRSKDSKLIYLLDGSTICRYCDVQHAKEIEFYNLAADPDELNNLAADGSDEMTRLREYAEKKVSEFENNGPNSRSDNTVEYEDESEIEERLEALGYK